MIVVVFEVCPHPDHKQEYLDLAADLGQFLSKQEGFISIERFTSLQDPSKILSLSYWSDEEAVSKWRNLPNHRAVQRKGRDYIFDDYTLRVANVIRDYGMSRREDAPNDSKKVHED